MQKRLFFLILFGIILGASLALLGYLGKQPLILAGGLLIFVLTFLKNPESGIFLFLITLPLSEGLNLHWFLIFLVVFLGLIFLLTRKVNFTANPALLFFLIFSVIWFFSLIHSGYKLFALKSFSSFTSLFFLYLIFREILRTKIQVKKALLAISISSLIPIGLALWQNYKGIGIVKGTGSYVFSLFENPNDFSLFLLACFPAYFTSIFWAVNKSTKLIIALFLISALVCLRFSYTRTVFIAVTVFLTVFLGLVFRPKIILPALGILFLPLAVKIIPGWFMPFPGFLETSFLWRMQYWRAVWDYFLARPVLGYGFGSSVHVLSNELGVSHFPHNVYLKLAFELGILGLVFYLVVIYLVFRQAVYIYRNAQERGYKIFASAIMAFLAGWLVCGLAIDVVIRHVALPLFFVMLALTGSIHKLVLNQKKVTG